MNSYHQIFKTLQLPISFVRRVALNRSAGSSAVRGTMTSTSISWRLTLDALSFAVQVFSIFIQFTSFLVWLRASFFFIGLALSLEISAYSVLKRGCDRSRIVLDSAASECILWRKKGALVVGIATNPCFSSSLALVYANGFRELDVRANSGVFLRNVLLILMTSSMGRRRLNLFGCGSGLISSISSLTA